MSVNVTESNIMHLRPNLVVIPSVTTKCVAQSASRAFGVLIAKCTSIEGVPYDVFAKLYMPSHVIWCSCMG